jgi:hypothetical protein
MANRTYEVGACSQAINLNRWSATGKFEPGLAWALLQQIRTGRAKLVLKAKTIAQLSLRGTGFLLLAVGGIILNIVEVTVIAMVLVSIAILAAHNIQCFRDYSLLLIPLLYTAIFLVIVLPGFFTVFFMSRLAGRFRSLGAIILAMTGAFIWLAFSALMIAWHGETNYWIILLGFISNVIGQLWAAIFIWRGRSKRDLLPVPMK